MGEIQKMSGESKDILAENIQKIKELFPEVITEDKIDFEQLKEVLGEYVEDKKERYKFEWHGKSQALRLSQTPSMGTLRPCKEESKNWDTTENLYIEGDNLEVLKLLQKTYHNRIKMIYIDPPYNTGKDFVYEDDFKDNMRNYLEITGQTDEEGNRFSTNSEAGGRYHTNWLNMMYPRLRLARNLLSDDGVIFISINDKEADNLKKICNEIFSERNFLSQIIWTNKEGGGSSDSKYFRVKHEYCFCYAKNIEKCEIKGVEISNLQRYTERDEYESERGPYYLQKLGMGSIQYSQSLDYPIEAPDGNLIFPRDNNNGNRACWRWSEEKKNWGIENGFIVIKKGRQGSWTVYTKQYLSCDNEGNRIDRSQRPIPIIDKYSSTQASIFLRDLGMANLFDYSKPFELIKQLANYIVDSDDIILDFFAGSSTTAHATMDINSIDEGKRKYIMVQLPEIISENTPAYNTGYRNVSEIGKERIRRVGDKIVSELKENQNGQQNLTENENKINPDDLDIGFKVFKLDTSNIKKWNPDPKADKEEIQKTIEDAITNILPGRTEEDLLYEIMLKFGIDLTYRIETTEVDGKKVYQIGNGMLYICLDDDISVDIAQHIVNDVADKEPESTRVVFKDNGFKGANADAMKTNVVHILKTAGIQEIMSV